MKTLPSVVLRTWSETKVLPQKQCLQRFSNLQPWNYPPNLQRQQSKSGWVRLSLFLYFWYSLQWRIQYFSDQGAPTLKVGALTYYLAKFFAKNCMKKKEIGLARPWRPLPPLRSANGLLRVVLNCKTPIIKSIQFGGIYRGPDSLLLHWDPNASGTLHVYH